MSPPHPGTSRLVSPEFFRADAARPPRPDLPRAAHHPVNVSLVRMKVQYLVMAGFSWPSQPRLVFLELPDLHPSAWQRASSAVPVRDDLLSRGYQVAYKDVTNTVFVRPDVWERGWGTATA